MHDADADIGLADIDIPHLLVEQFFGERLLLIVLEFAQGNVGAGAHRAGRLRFGGIDLHLRLSRSRQHDAQQRRKTPNEPIHDDLPVFPAWMHAPAGFAKHAISNPNCQTTKTALPRRKPLAPADPRFYGAQTRYSRRRSRFCASRSG